MTSDEQRLLRGIQRVVEQQRKMDEAGKRVKKTGDDVANTFRKVETQSDKSFGQKQLTNLTRMAAGLLTVQKAWGAIVDAMREAQKLAQEAEAGVRTAAGGMARLGQLSEDPREQRRFRREARAAFAAGVGTDLGQAADFIFALQSAGALGEREFFQQLQSSGLLPDAGNLAKSANTLRTAMGTALAGTFEEVSDQALAASGFNPDQVGPLLEAAAKSGASAAALGTISPESLLTATALAASGAGGAAEGGTAVASFLKNVERFGGRAEGVFGERRDLTGDIEDMVRQLNDMAVSGDDLFKLLGNERAVKGFRLLAQNIDVFDERRAEVAAARTSQSARARVRATLEDQTVATANREQQARNQAILAREAQGQASLLVNTLERENLTRARQAGASRFAQGLTSMFQNRIRPFIDEEQALRNIAANPEAMANINQDTAEAIRAFLRSQDAITESMTGAAETIQTAGEMMVRAADTQADPNAAARTRVNSAGRE